MALGFVRPASPDDAREIARIQLTTWRHAYRRILPQHVVDGIDEAWVTRRWQTSIEDPPSPRHTVLVAVEQAQQAYLVGFVATGEVDETSLAPEEEPGKLLRPDVASITDLLVEPRFSRRGHGSRLLSACADFWREHAFATAVAWSFEADPAMQAFLTSAGWEPDGASRALDVDDLLVPQVRLHTSIG
jgi:GNAT superfamily N-acetyltransferase